jgi:hypothetical protein
MDALRLFLRVRKSKDRESLYYYFTAKYFLPPTPQKQGYGRSGSAALPATGASLKYFCYNCSAVNTVNYVPAKPLPVILQRFFPFQLRFKYHP